LQVPQDFLGIPIAWHPIRLILACLGLLLWLVQYFREPWLKRIEDAGSRFASKKGAVILGAAVVSIVARLILLHWCPVPVPYYDDEYSYLLAADTFSHGRLANPPHPLPVFFDTLGVLQSPTYASPYPPAQGMVLALGQLLGNPWIGVLLSMAAMCAAVAWALQGWLPARWALLGTLLMILQIDLMSYWADSYLGGAVAAAGAALVLGALPRILRRFRLADSGLMGIGAAVLANSRPYEGFVFCLPVVAVLAVRFLRGPIDFKLKLARALWPATAVLACTGLFIGYYNWRVTGNALLLPHALIGHQWGDFPVFVWQRLKPTPTYANAQFTRYVEFFRDKALGPHWIRHRIGIYKQAWTFFLGPWLSVPLLALPWVARDRKSRFLVFQAAWCVTGFLLVNFFEMHYAAPLTATIFGILTQGMRHIRQWTLKSYRVGVFASRLIVVLVISRIFLPNAETIKVPTPGFNVERAQIAAQLQAKPDKNLVIVSYKPDHLFNEWVYNAADIDASKVVWVRYIPGLDMKPLLDYYHDRKVWVVDADAEHPSIQPFPGDLKDQSSR
jgi:hypothetical protein